jgi:16S rRNA U1498 N3-methylase RsmE
VAFDLYNSSIIIGGKGIAITRNGHVNLACNQSSQVLHHAKVMRANSNEIIQLITGNSQWLDPPVIKSSLLQIMWDALK